MKRLIWLFLCAISLAQTTNYARMLSGVNYQSGTTYIFQAIDSTRVTQFSNAAAVSVTLSAGSTAGFQAGTVFTARNNGTGKVTITCSGCTINGSGTFALTNGQAADIYSDGLNYVVNSGGGGTAGSFTLKTSAAGFVSGDATDNTAAFNTAMSTIFSAGGGTLICDQPGTYLFNSAQIQIPNDGGTWADNGGTVPANKPIRITGQGNGMSTSDTFTAGLITATNGGCIFDMQFNATTAKIVTLGQGQLELDHLAFVDNGSDCAAFVFTTNTSLAIHDNTFLGTVAANHNTPIYSCNDAILLGSSATTSNGTVNSIFQAYNTKIHHNFFDKVQRAVFAQNWVNGIEISNNVIWVNSGSNAHGLIEFICGASNQCEGNFIANNLIETVNPQYGINLSGFNVYSNFLYGNSCYDGTAANLACIHEGNEGLNTIVGGGYLFTGGSPTYFSTIANAYTNSNIFAAPVGTSVGHETAYFLNNDAAGISGARYENNGSVRGWIGTCGPSCNPASSTPAAPSLFSSNMFMWANTNDNLLFSKTANGLDVVSSNHTNVDFQIDTTGNANVISPFGASTTYGKSACETAYGITTLATGSTTTNTGLNCLPANAVIDSVVYRITTTITTAANFTIGDSVTAARFCTTQSTLTAGTTGICFAQAGSASEQQTSAASVRVTTNVNPGAGAMRLIVFYHTWTAPTS